MCSDDEKFEWNTLKLMKKLQKWLFFGTRKNNFCGHFRFQKWAKTGHKIVKNGLKMPK